MKDNNKSKCFLLRFYEKCESLPHSHSASCQRKILSPGLSSIIRQWEEEEEEEEMEEEGEVPPSTN